LCLALGVIALAGCSLDDLVSKAALPMDTLDPKGVQTEAAAIGAYNDAVLQLSKVLGQSQPRYDSLPAYQMTGQSYVMASALLSDEAGTHYGLLAQILGTASPFPVTGEAAVDARTPYENLKLLKDGMYDQPYLGLQVLRLRVAEALGALRAYAPNTPQAMLGHLYALRGYAEVMLAELYCSGVPLSQYNFNAQPTYGMPATSEQVFRHAVAQFDTAIVLSGDSARILNFAKIGRGRALLDLGDAAAAADAVADVPLTFQYAVPYSTTRPNPFVSGPFINLIFSASSGEGGNGLPYAGDPRSMQVSITGLADLVKAPAKYVTATGGDSVTGLQNAATASIILASGLEGQLIAAEAALSDGGSTTILNTLRSICVGSAACAPWPGIAASSLAALQTPTSDSAAVTQLFAERAYWLYFTGHRQGDLRRLIRQYHRNPEDVYPTGIWPVGTVPYGAATSLPIPDSERLNPNFHGCLSHDA
jgi:hypothetical protein